MCGHTLDEAHIQHVLYLLKSRELDHLLSKNCYTMSLNQHIFMHYLIVINVY